jgi:mRNA export factor
MGGPIFQIEWTDDCSILIVALASGKVKGINMAQGQIGDICEHPNLTDMKLISFNNQNIVLTIGTDQNLIFWTTGNPQPMATVKLQHVPLVMDFSLPYLVIACNDSQIAVIQMEKFMQNQKVVYCKSNLDSPIMSIALKPNSHRLAACSIDGRICMTDMSFDNYGNVKFTDYILFRAHRNEVKNQPQQSYLYQVNGIGFNKKFPNYLYSVGSNSVTFFWDCVNKNKSAEFNYGGVQVTAADHSPCGRFFAYALGYDWSMGVWELPNVKSRPFVCVHAVKENEIRIN